MNASGSQLVLHTKMDVGRAGGEESFFVFATFTITDSLSTATRMYARTDCRAFHGRKSDPERRRAVLAIDCRKRNAQELPSSQRTPCFVSSVH